MAFPMASCAVNCAVMLYGISDQNSVTVFPVMLYELLVIVTTLPLLLALNMSFQFTDGKSIFCDSS